MSRESVHVRVATAADAALLSKLATRTFVETFVEDFAMPYSAADVAAFVPATYGEDALRRYLDDGAHRYLVAEQGGRAVGYALAGPNKLPHPESRPEDGELQRIYVVRDAQGAGAGSALFDAAIGWLDSSGPRTIWIGVWSGNERARAFYARRGFVKVGEYKFRVGETLDHEHILRRAPRGA